MLTGVSQKNLEYEKIGRKSQFLGQISRNWHQNCNVCNSLYTKIISATAIIKQFLETFATSSDQHTRHNVIRRYRPLNVVENEPTVFVRFPRKSNTRLLHDTLSAAFGDVFSGCDFNGVGVRNELGLVQDVEVWMFVKILR